MKVWGEVSGGRNYSCRAWGDQGRCVKRTDTRVVQRSRSRRALPVLLLYVVDARDHGKSQKQRLRVSVFLGCHLVKIMPAMTPVPVSGDRESNE